MLRKTMLRKTIKNTRGSAGTSGLDVDDWRQILISGNFGTSREGERNVIADLTHRLRQDKIAKQFGAFLMCKLISFDKQTCGTGEVLRRIIEKIVIKVLRRDNIATLSRTGRRRLSCYPRSIRNV